MKRNVTLGICGTAAIAIGTAALLRPSVAQTVETTEPAAAPSTPAAAAPAGAVLQGEPVAGGAALTFTPAAAETPTAIAEPATGMPPGGAPPAGEGGAVYGLIATPAAPGENNPFADPYVNSAPALGAYFLRADQPTLQHLAAAVRGAKDDAARAAATEKMQKTLNETFDADMKRREQELAKLEERLKALRQQMTRRQAKKAEIIELQSRVLLNEADGLGFYSSDEAIYARPGGVATYGAAVFEGEAAVIGGAPPAATNLPAAPANPATP